MITQGEELLRQQLILSFWTNKGGGDRGESKAGVGDRERLCIELNILLPAPP